MTSLASASAIAGVSASGGASAFGGRGGGTTDDSSDVLYVGTSGALTITAPTGGGDIVRVAGYTIDAAGLIYFDPSNDWIVLV